MVEFYYVRGRLHIRGPGADAGNCYDGVATEIDVRHHKAAFENFFGGDQERIREALWRLQQG